MNDEIKETNDLWVKINDNDIKEVLDYYKKDIEDYEKRALDGYGISNKEAYQRYKNHKLILYCINDLREELDRCVKANVILDDENAELQGKITDLQEERDMFERMSKWSSEVMFNYKSRNEKAVDEIQQLIDGVNNRTIIGLKNFIPKLEEIQDKLVGGDE